MHRIELWRRSISLARALRRARRWDPRRPFQSQVRFWWGRSDEDVHLEEFQLWFAKESRHLRLTSNLPFPIVSNLWFCTYTHICSACVVDAVYAAPAMALPYWPSFGKAEKPCLPKQHLHSFQVIRMREGQWNKWWIKRNLSCIELASQILDGDAILWLFSTHTSTYGHFKSSEVISLSMLQLVPDSLGEWTEGLDTPV